MSDIDHNPKLDRLALTDLTVGFSEQTFAEVADLTLRLHQRGARERGAMLSIYMQRAYADRSETEQLGMRAAVKHVVIALLLLNLVELRPL